MKRMDFMKDPEREGEDSVFVGNERKKKLDLFPKIICFVIALFIWIYMMNLNVTDVTATITLKITVDGEEKLEREKNMMIYGIDKETVTVTVRGSNRDIKKYTEADYAAVVDVSGIDECGMATLPVEIRVPSGSSLTVSNTEQLSVKLYSDNSMTKNVPIEIVKGEVITTQAYEYEFVSSHETVEISGPKSAVELIAKAKYQLEGEFYSSKSYSGFALQFFDANDVQLAFGPEILSYSTNDMTISVNVTTVKSVPIKVTIVGEGNDLVPVLNIPEILIKGDPAVIAGVTEYPLTIEHAIKGDTLEVVIDDDKLPVGVTVVEKKTLSITFVAPEQE